MACTRARHAPHMTAAAALWCPVLSAEAEGPEGPAGPPPPPLRRAWPSLRGGQGQHLHRALVAAYVDHLATRPGLAPPPGTVALHGPARDSHRGAARRRLLSHVQDDVDRQRTVFLPIQDTQQHWCLCVVRPGTPPRVYVVDALAHGHRARPRSSLVTALARGLRGCRASRPTPLPCHPVLADTSTSGVRTLHQLHVLLHGRFWDTDVAAWTAGHPLLLSPVDCATERAHLERALAPSNIAQG